MFCYIFSVHNDISLKKTTSEICSPIICLQNLLSLSSSTLKLYSQEICHPHTTEELLQQEVSAIGHSYFKFSVPPHLQLDIQPSMADQGVYIFREPHVQVSMLLAKQAHNVSTQIVY